MQQELSGVFLLLMVVALVALGFILRRLSKEGGGKSTAKTKHIQSGRPVPNENPARGAVKKPPEVQEFDAVNVHRPTMLALTTVRENAVSPEVFIQRAFKIDREHWMEIESTEETRRKLDVLFAHVCQLAWVPGSAFERHIYSVSFAPALEAALQEGIFRTDCSAGVVTHVSAIDETGEALGDPMKMSLAASKLGLVAALWSAFNPKGMPHELRAELDKENAEVAKRLSDLPQHVAYETVASWTMRYASLSAVVAAVKSGVTAEQVPEYLKEIDSISKDMHEQADRIDEAIEQRAANVFNLEDADDALIQRSLICTCATSRFVSCASARYCACRSAILLKKKSVVPMRWLVMSTSLRTYVRLLPPLKKWPMTSLILRVCGQRANTKFRALQLFQSMRRNLQKFTTDSLPIFRKRLARCRTILIRLFCARLVCIAMLCA